MSIIKQFPKEDTKFRCYSHWSPQKQNDIMWTVTQPSHSVQTHHDEESTAGEGMSFSPVTENLYTNTVF
jgi:hypothetical protein